MTQSLTAEASAVKIRKEGIPMKRTLALVLAALMVLTAVSAMADGHVSFTINACHSNSEMDYTHDGLYDLISQKFDFDFEVYPVSKDAQSEKLRIWINGGTMPTVVTWRNFDYQEYVTYAEQGLIAALPDGWEEKYPNLYWMVQVSGIYDQMKLDGVSYGIPHATFARFGGMGSVVPTHLSLYYRKDWAAQLGMEIGTTMTLAQLEEYIRGCIDHDLAGNGNTLGLSDDPDNMANFWMLYAGVDHDAFSKGEDGLYRWNFADPGVLSAIQTANEWYQKGLLDRDFYLNQSADAVNNFTSGIAACMYINCAISSYAGYAATFEESTGLDATETLGIVTMALDDGTPVTIQTNNWWGVTEFSPDIDDETLDRILSMMDWICTEEGQLTVLVGVPGETWEYDADGNIVMLSEKDENGKYPQTVDLYNSYNVFRTLGILADDYSFINPANDPDIVAQVKEMYATRANAKIIPMDMDYEFFSSDNKANYSLDLSDEITRLIISTDASTIAADWESYIAENSAIWQPVIDDLNAAFCK